MIPVGAIFGAVVAVSALNRRRNGGGGTKGTKEERRSPGALAFFIDLDVGPAFIYFLTRLITRPDVWGVLGTLVCWVVLFPWFTARWLLIPLGWVRPAFCVGILSGWCFQRDMRGAGLLCGAWALLRKGRPDPAAEAWLVRRLAKTKPLRGAGVVARGFLAVYSSDGRGNLEDARVILRGVESMHSLVAPRMARCIASEWLAADAAQRGDWLEVRHIGHRVKGPRSRTTRFMGAVAARLCGEDPVMVEWGTGVHPAGPHNAVLWLRWLLCPRRIAAWSLLRRALSVPRQPPRPSPWARALEASLDDPENRPQGVAEQAVVSAHGSAAVPSRLLSSALSLHCRALLPNAPAASLSASDFWHLCATWDRALSAPATLRRTGERALVLGVADGEAVLRKMTAEVQAELTGLARASRLCLDEGELAQGPPLLRKIARALRDQLLGELELSCDALRSRTDARRELPLLDEWREWEGVRARYEEGARRCGMGFLRLAWPKLHTDVCQQAVWLWNERKETALANTIFQWLLAEAKLHQDERAIELETKNTRCGP